MIGGIAGAMIGAPFSLAYNCGWNLLKRRYFTLEEQTVTEKMQRAIEHAAGIRGRVNVASLRKAARSRLERSTTAQLKQEAKKGLEAKHKALLERLSAHGIRKTLWRLLYS